MTIGGMEDALRAAGWSECETRTPEGASKFVFWAKFPDYQTSAGDLFWLDCYVLADAYRVLDGEDVVPEARIQLRKGTAVM
jgi:hypothetical protein